MKKKTKVYLSMLLATCLLFFRYDVIKSESFSPKECIKQHNRKVLKDIQSSFPELKILDARNNVDEYYHKDIDRAMRVIGGKADPHIESLRSLYTGISIGDRRFFIVNDLEGYLGYFLYKKLDGTNVMLKMRPGKDKWEVVEQKEKKGTLIKWPKECGK